MRTNELPVTGYLDRFSHRPGETFSCHVSVPSGGTFRARLIRVISGDPNPAGPGLRFVDGSDRFDQTFPARHQPISLGSYGIARDGPPCEATAARTWTAPHPMGRALGYPTRMTYGINPFPKNSPSHCKMEAFLPPYGWVAFDVSDT